MKKEFLSVFLLFSSLALLSQTNVGGLISVNTHWALSGSPYIVVSNILIENGAVLTIDPGTEIRFDSLKLIQVRGGLVARGTESNNIIFTSNSANPAPGDWKYILFEDESLDYDTVSQTGSIFKNCIIEYGGTNNISGESEIRLYSANPLIDSCYITNSAALGVYGTMLNSFQISNCIITNNQWGGINIEGYYVKILKNTFKNNGSYSLDCPALTARGSNYLLIKENIICNNKGESIDVGGYGITSFEKNIIVNNKSVWNYQKSCSVFSNNMSISNNIFANNGDYSSVVMLAGSIIKFKNNQIIRNQGILLGCNGSGYPNTNSDIIYNTSADNNVPFLHNYLYYFRFLFGFPSVFTNNNFFDNRIESPSNYYLFNDNNTTSPNLIAENNFWNVTNSLDIDNLIYDWFDNPSYGLVDYTPFLTVPDTIAPVSPPFDITKTDLGGGHIQINWSPNIESDIAGYKIYYGFDSCCSFSNMIDVGNVTSYIVSGLNFTDTIAVTAYDNLADGYQDQFDGNESWFAFDYDSITHVHLAFDNSLIITTNPNPTTDKVFIEYSHELSDCMLSLINSNGIEVKKLQITGLVTEIDLSGFSKGIYYLSVMQKNRILGIKKIVKE